MFRLLLPQAPPLPKVYILNEALVKATKEVKKFYLLGKNRDNNPCEASMYILAVLVQRPGIFKSPFELLELSEIESVIVTHVVYPADKFKDNKPGYAGFKAPKGYTANRMNMIFREMLLTYINRYPLIDLLGNIHSHTFIKADSMSGGDNQDSKRSMARFKRSGLNTRFKFLMSPNSNSGEDWGIYGFAYQNGNPRRLSGLEVISRNHSLFKAAIEKPCYYSSDFTQWAKQQCYALEVEFGLKLRWEQIVRGWSTLDVLNLNGKEISICFPPFFPESPIKVYYFNGKKYIALNTEGFNWKGDNEQLRNLKLTELIKIVKEKT